MRTLRLLLILLLFPALSRAASPSFNSFIPTQFTNNGVVIGLNTNYVLTWQMVSTNSFTTNGNNLAINTNTFPTLLVIRDMVNSSSNQLYGVSTNFTLLARSVTVFSNAFAGPFTNSDGRITWFVSTNTAGVSNTFNGAQFTNISGNISIPYNAMVTNINLRNQTNGVRIVGPISSFTGSGGLELDYVALADTANVQAYDRNAAAFRNLTLSGLSLSLAVNGTTAFTITNTGGASWMVFRSDNTWQRTAATNAVRLFGIDGVTVSPSNNTANGSIDYRISLAEPRYSPVVIPITETNMVFSTATNAWFTYSLTNNTTFTVSGLAVGAQATLYLTADGSTRTLAFPGFTWLEGVPASIAAGKRMRIHMFSYGTTATNVSAVYAVEL